jgi:GTP-binding protein HflX
LNEIGAVGKPAIMVFNKIDCAADGAFLMRLREKYPHAVEISAKTGEGVPHLLAEIGTQLRPKREFVELQIPHENADVIARLHQVGQVVERRYNGKSAKFKARIPPHLHAEFERFICR